ncbi:hypothetical protein BGZ58_001431 [Dissophora ornata]|nr:hypothetical protein BGZ58_001431 [Dissophora ornata]
MSLTSTPESSGAIDIGNLLAPLIEYWTIQLEDSLTDTTALLMNRGMKQPKRKAKLSPELASHKRWYFKPNTASNSSTDRPMFDCTLEKRSAMRIDASSRYTDWGVRVTGLLDPGLYEVILAISTDGLQLDRIESITLTSCTNFKGSISAPLSEIITNKNLRKIVTPGSDVTLLRLQQHYEVDSDDEYCDGRQETRFVLEIVMNALAHPFPGYLDVHYMKLQAFRAEQPVLDPHIKTHRPFVWSLNALRGKPENSEMSERRPKTFLDFAVSGDGTHVALLTAADTMLFLDLWDVGSLGLSNNLTSMTETQRTVTACESFSPLPRASVRIPIPLLSSMSRLYYAASVSWDASQIALLDSTDDIAALSGLRTRESSFVVYDYTEGRRLQSRLRPATNYQHIPGLEKFCGFGKFHTLTTSDRAADSEHFVTCDGVQVRVYTTHQQWNHIRSINLTPRPPARAGMKFTQSIQKVDPFIIFERRRLIKSLKGRLFAWSGNPDNMVSVYDIETGSVISSFRNIPPQSRMGIAGCGAAAEFSSSGASLVTTSRGTLNVYNTTEGRLMGTYEIPGWHVEIFTVRFIRGDTQILVETLGNNEEYGELNAQFTFDNESFEMTPQIQHPFSGESQLYFLASIKLLLPLIYEEADDACRKAILRYVGLHMSSYPCVQDPESHVVSAIVSGWVPEAQRIYELFTGALLDGTNGTWVPPQDRRPEANPLRTLYRGVIRHPRAIITAESIIDYCIRQGRQDNDSRFLQPVIQTLNLLLDRHLHQPDVALRTLRRLAFFQTGKRQFVINHHSIVNNPGILRFWDEDSRKLFKHKDPIIQLDLNVDNQDPLNDNFTREIFEAWIEMVWTVQGGESCGTEFQSAPRYGIFALTHWIYVLLRIALHKCKLKSQPIVKCHDFTLESLDNLAIAAVIEYKWQAKIQSMYNLVDLVTFGIPLAASVNHLLLASKIIQEDHNIGLFSFSALFIFLHLLFELRVVKSVCYFVTIIIQAIYKIRVFFVVFALGLVAFTIAYIHLLHGCAVQKCEPSSSFPSNFYSAFSTTYFFMGGRYDQISDEMNSDFWEFQTLMIIFFSFTVILMLNVLIALINKAFNDGDESWRLTWLDNRLRIVEAAEDMSYRIPGSHNWFPEIIYYSATPQQIRAYEEKYFDGNKEFIMRENNYGGDLRLHNPYGFQIPSNSLKVERSDANSASNVAVTEAADDADKLRQSFGALQREFTQSRVEIQALQRQLQEQQRQAEAQASRLEEQLREQNRQLQGQAEDLRSNLVATLVGLLSPNTTRTETLSCHF